MDNPASPIMTSLVKDTLVSESLKKLSFEVPFLKIYVVDTILVIPKAKTNDVLEIFKAFHPRLQFTLEVEQNNEIPFLDILLLQQSDGQLKTKKVL